MLSSVWTRRTTDAVLACYASLIIAYLVTQVFLSGTSALAWIDPVPVLGDLVTPQIEVRLHVVALHLAAWLVIGVTCLTLATLRLRPACLGQAERRPGRWLWAFRPRVGDAPIRWRERYIIGLAPLPWLRLVPTWLALLGVLSFSAILAVTALDSILGPGFSYAIRAGNFALAGHILERAQPESLGTELAVMGIILLVSGVIVVGVRCGGSIAEEKRRKTWEDLVLTPLSLHEIVRDKRRGVILATLPYLAVYSLPMFALSTLGGTSEAFVVAAWVIAAFLAMLGAAFLAMEVTAGVEMAGLPDDLPPELPRRQPSPRRRGPGEPGRRGERRRKPP
jgi:hypothetical protein